MPAVLLITVYYSYSKRSPGTVPSHSSTIVPSLRVKRSFGAATGSRIGVTREDAAKLEAQFRTANTSCCRALNLGIVLREQSHPHLVHPAGCSHREQLPAAACRRHSGFPYEPHRIDRHRGGRGPQGADQHLRTRDLQDLRRPGREEVRGRRGDLHRQRAMSFSTAATSADIY